MFFRFWLVRRQCILGRPGSSSMLGRSSPWQNQHRRGPSERPNGPTNPWRWRSASQWKNISKDWAMSPRFLNHGPKKLSSNVDLYTRTILTIRFLEIGATGMASCIWLLSHVKTHISLLVGESVARMIRGYRPMLRKTAFTHGRNKTLLI